MFKSVSPWNARFFCAIMALLFWGSLQAQDLPIARNLQKAYTNGTRSADGQPGTKYWQNKADYDIYITFSPTTRLISGTVSIQYINNSPDTLREVVFKLYPNLYKKGAQRLMEISPEDAGDGLIIETLSVDGAQIKAADYRISSTNMVVRPKSIPPGKSTQFKIAYNYTLNKDSHIRTGQVDPGAWFIAYCFPRIAVYDDIDGWNRNQYLGTQEFYNDFCDFKVAVKVPKNYIVWGTGDLT
ncbi:MAG: peptidase, partial [Saprospiraceae bacterium]